MAPRKIPFLSMQTRRGRPQQELQSAHWQTWKEGRRASVNQSDKYSTSSTENSKQSSGGSSDPSSSYKNVNGSFYGNEKQGGGGNNFSSSSAADHADKSPGCCSLCCRACCRCGRYGTYCTRCTWILFFLGLLIGALAIGGLIAAALTSQLSG